MTPALADFPDRGTPSKAQIPLCRLLVTSLLALIPLRRFPRKGSFGEVGVMELRLKGTSRVCGGRHGEIGIVEFGFNVTRR